jgi:hypothetical protein
LNNSDLIHRCYIEVELPLLYFSDTYITNPEYIQNKKILMNNYISKKLEWETKFNNLNGYAQIELELYRNLKLVLNTNNVNIITLKNIVNNFNFKNKNLKTQFINNINNLLFNSIDITNYILNLTNDNIETITNNLDNIYDNILYYLKYYNYFIIKYNNLINELSKENQINFSFANYLGHNMFTNYGININGFDIANYDNSYLHINQLHNIKNQYLDNYLDMIGHVDNLYNYDNNYKGNRKILIPLQFWFNKDSGLSLPLVALQYTDSIINIKLNKLNKIITFENYDDMYNNLLIIEIENPPKKIIYNKKLIYNKFKINEFSITYYCIYINNELLKYLFTNLLDDERLYILKTYGTYYPNIKEHFTNIIINDEIDQYYINIYQWTHFMNNINNTPVKHKLNFYYPYIDYNIYYSLINQFNIKLITENIYLDNKEREKFANSKLEYIIEINDMNIYNFELSKYYTCNLVFNKPCKDILWYIQPQIYYDGYNYNGKNKDLLFDLNILSSYQFYNKQQLYLNNDTLLLNEPMNYYTYLLSYKFLNNILPDGVFYHSFSLYPENIQPSGTVNFRYIKNKYYTIDINNNFILDYNNIINIINPNKNKFIIKFITKNYQLLIIHKSQVKFLYV